MLRFTPVRSTQCSEFYARQSFQTAALCRSRATSSSNAKRIARPTGLFAGMLVALYITFEVPLSGMSMNPARTLGSAVIAQSWMALWIYFTAPPLGMLLATELYVRITRQRPAMHLSLRLPV